MLSPPNKQIYPKPRHRLGKFLILIAWFTVLGFAAIHHQDIFDWYKLRDYDAPAVVSQLATQDTMTDYGRKVFYVNHPSALDKPSFVNHCPAGSKSEQTIVLGCYHGFQNGIYLLNVDDPRLNGVEQVTAAHEMLHAAYDRLSSKERDRVDAMLLNYYTTSLTDHRILATIDAYKKSEPNDLVNEMHSIFATEISTLPPQLEQYYSQYFTNRAQVAGFAATYQAEFTSRQNIVTADDARLATMKTQIDQLTDDIRSKQANISSQRSILNGLRSSDVEAYNAAVPGYNSLVNAYNSEIDQLRSLINQYNQLVNERNAVALEADQLTRELSSDVQPINN
jgi:hypothetical protein